MLVDFATRRYPLRNGGVDILFRPHSTRWIGAPYAFDQPNMVRAVDAVSRWQRVVGGSGLKTFGNGVRKWSALAHQSSENSVRDGGSLGGSTRISGSSKSTLFHRQVDVVVREGHKRETRGLRKEGLWYVVLTLFSVACILQALQEVAS